MVCNHAKLTCDAVAARLDGTAPPPALVAPPYAFDALAQIAQHCTQQEDNANKVERQVLKAAAAFLLDRRIGQVFNGIVTGTPSKGTFARITSPMVEGRIVQGFKGLQVGDAVQLRLVAVDAAQGFIDFEHAPA